jgi:hypothetical protein
VGGNRFLVATARRGVAALVGTVSMLTLAPVARADLFMHFEQASARIGERVAITSYGSYPKVRGVRVYFVPMRLARAETNLRSTGPPRIAGIIDLGPLRQDTNGVARTSFRIPQVPHGNYTIGVWCIPCAPPRGAFFTSARPGTRWNDTASRVLRVTTR